MFFDLAQKIEAQFAKHFCRRRRARKSKVEILHSAKPRCWHKGNTSAFFTSRQSEKPYPSCEYCSRPMKFAVFHALLELWLTCITTQMCVKNKWQARGRKSKLELKNRQLSLQSMVMGCSWTLPATWSTCYRNWLKRHTLQLTDRLEMRTF